MCQLALSGDQQQSFLAFRLQRFTLPGEELNRDDRDRTARDKAQRDSFGIGPEQSITSEGFRIAILLFGEQLLKAQRFSLRPGLQARLLQARPPNLIAEAEHKLRMGGGQADQSVMRLIFACMLGRDSSSSRGRAAS